MNYVYNFVYIFILCARNKQEARNKTRNRTHKPKQTHQTTTHKEGI